MATPAGRAMRRRALRARELARRLRDRVRGWRRRRPVVELASVGRRLELLLAALYGRPITIVAADDTRRPGLLAQYGMTRHLHRARSLASLDGGVVHLPRELSVGDSLPSTLQTYRLLALEQAERLHRGSAAHLPPDGAPIERDLYLLAESAAVDSAIARTCPGLRDALAAARTAALAERPAPRALTVAERYVEELISAALSAPALEPPERIPLCPTPDTSLAWARDMAAALATSAGSDRGRYRGTAPVALWGAAPRAIVGAEAPTMPRELPPPARLPPNAVPLRGGRTAAAPASGPSDIQVASPEGRAQPSQRIEDPAGNVLHHDPHGVPHSDAFPREDDASTLDLPAGVFYPEWDHEAGAYRPRGAIVRAGPPEEGDETWAPGVLADHAPLVRRIRHEFEQLRARRLRMSRQLEGDELDIAACVRALSDRRTGHSSDERLYQAVRRARRGTAITLLADVSGSTDAPVAGGAQVIAIEKIALLLAGEALDALGDVYSALAFSGRGANDVRVSTLKAAAEPNGVVARRRIASLRPGGFTRLGAAVRHAAAGLSAQSGGHRLLLIPSDGRPNDIGTYNGAYAIEDTRQAIFEARARGIFPFCLTVDAVSGEGQEYLAHIFGRAGYTLLRRPAQLPMALLRVVRQLLRPA
ncbi:MAG: hypothetical protein WKG32_04845 [Gemmatimonadaceae bacterium]